MADGQCWPLHDPPVFYFSPSIPFYPTSPSHFWDLHRPFLLGSMCVLWGVSLLVEHNEHSVLVCVMLLSVLLFSALLIYLCSSTDSLFNTDIVCDLTCDF